MDRSEPGGFLVRMVVLLTSPLDALGNIVTRRTAEANLAGNRIRCLLVMILVGWNAGVGLFCHMNFTSLACFVTREVGSLIVDGVEVGKGFQALQCLGGARVHGVFCLIAHPQRDAEG